MTATTTIVEPIHAEPPTPRPRVDPHWLLIAAPVALLTAVVCLIGSDRQLWVDENATFYVTTLSWADFTRLLDHQDLVHGLYYLFIRAWVDVFGSSLLALRLPSIIAMATAAGGLTLLGRRLHSAAVGLTAGLLFAALPAVSRFGQEARSYALVSALVVLSTLALTYALASPTWLRWLAYFGPALTLVYLHFAAGLILLPHAIMVIQALVAGGRRRQIARWFAVAGAVTVLVDPLLSLASEQVGQVLWIRADWAAVQWYPSELFMSATVAWAMILLGVAGATALATARRRIVWPLLVWAIVPPVFSYVTFDFAHLFLAKYSLYILPAWCLLAAVAIVGATANATTWITRTQCVGVAAAVAIVALAGFGAQIDVRRSPLVGEPDFRAAAAIVDKGFQPGDGVVYAGTDRWGRLPFAYELRRARPVEVFAQETSQAIGEFAPLQCDDPTACLGSTARLWLVASSFSDDIYAGLPEGQAKLLRDGFDVTSTSTVTRASVSLLVRKITK
jgi:mannosyltransferase